MTLMIFGMWIHRDYKHQCRSVFMVNQELGLRLGRSLGVRPGLRHIEHPTSAIAQRAM